MPNKSCVCEGILCCVDVPTNPGINNIGFQQSTYPINGVMTKLPTLLVEKRGKDIPADFLDLMPVEVDRGQISQVLNTGEMLPLLGYDAEFACDGLEAIALYTRAFASRKPFDAVILDLTIRGAMGGKDAVKKLLEIDPGVRAIVSSGYSNDAVLSNFGAYGFKGMVSKPYQLEERLVKRPTNYS